jgi:hypothetical protein
VGIDEALPYVPAAEVLPGIDLLALPEGYTPLAAIAIIKTLDDDGGIAWLVRYEKGLGGVEALGALHMAVNNLAEDVRNAYRPDPTEDD